MGKQAFLAIAGGGLSAALSLAAVYGAVGGFALAYLAALPLFLVGLGLGANAAALAASAGLGVVALASGAVGAGVYGGLHALPSWLVVFQALLRRVDTSGAAVRDDWYPIGGVLATLAMVTGFAVVCTAAFAAGDGGIEAGVQGLLARALAVAVPALDEAQREAVVGALAPLFVGLSGASWQLMIVVNAVLAENLLARRGRALRPKPAWSRLSVPGWLSWPLVAAAALGLVAPGDAGYLARNLVIVLAVPYFLVGLAIIHDRSREMPARPVLLFAIYLLLVLMGALVATVIAAVGMIWQWSGRWPGHAGDGRERRE